MLFMVALSRLSARAMVDHGMRVFLYHFDFNFTGYLPVESASCQADNMLLCGVYHASDLRFVFNTLQVRACA